MTTSSPEYETLFVPVTRFWHEAFNARNLDIINDLFAPDYRLHFPLSSPGAPLEGLENLRDFLERIGNGMPDGRAIIELQYPAAADAVVTHLAFEAPLPLAAETAEGDEPSVEWASYRGVSISRIVDGRIAETWLFWEAERAEVELTPDIRPWVWRWPPWQWP